MENDPRVPAATVRMLAVVTLTFTSGCGKSGGTAAGETIKIDGSSTVYPITEAVAEEFMKAGKARVTIGVSGTGGGARSSVEVRRSSPAPPDPSSPPK